MVLRRPRQHGNLLINSEVTMECLQPYVPLLSLKHETVSRNDFTAVSTMFCTEASYCLLRTWRFFCYHVLELSITFLLESPPNLTEDSVKGIAV